MNTKHMSGGRTQSNIPTACGCRMNHSDGEVSHDGGSMYGIQWINYCEGIEGLSFVKAKRIENIL